MVTILTVLLWGGTGGDEDTTGKEERREKGGERRRYERAIWVLQHNGKLQGVNKFRVRGQPTFQHLLSTLLPCYMDSLHLNIYSSDFRHATWTTYISTITLQIPAMLHGQPTL